MKKNCIGLVDLLCAYSDGELNESDILIVEDHLAICENCSAILKMYSEISDSINVTNVPAPEALKIGVMNRIMSDDIHETTEIDNKKQHGRFQFILTRYAPIAAGLVVMLLVWQFWGDLFGARNNAAIPAAAPQMDAGGSVSDVMPAPAEAAAPEVAFDTTDDDDIVWESMEANESEAPAADTSAPAALSEHEELMILDDENRSTQEAERIMTYISGAYAEIAFSGELPSLLTQYEPQPFGSWFGWEMVFEIPSSEVPALLAELSDHDGVIVVYNDNNSTYSIVLFSQSV